MMTLAEKRVIQFLHKTDLRPPQLIALVAIPCQVTESDAREAFVHLLSERLILLSPDHIVSLAPSEEDALESR